MVIIEGWKERTGEELNWWMNEWIKKWGINKKERRKEKGKYV